jgi:hypothetical protein
LNLAVYNLNPKILNLICEALPAIDRNDDSVQNALLAAIEFGYIEAIDKILRPDDVKFLYCNELFIANFRGNLKKIEAFFSKGKDFNKGDEYKRSLLI